MPPHIQYTMGREIVFIMKSIVHYESSKEMGQFEDESLTTHCQKLEMYSMLNFRPHLGMVC